MKIYVASSWRNPYQPDIVEALRSKKHEVYDFRNPRPGDRGFHWSEIDPDYKSWQPTEYRQALTHPMAETGFKSDFDAMKWADVFVGVAPFGRSTSLEMGWAAGAGKATILYLPEMLGEAELMVKMCGPICVNQDELFAAISRMEITAELEPCPFCGSKPELSKSRDAFYWCVCKKCGIHTVSESLQKTVGRWNTRYLPAPEVAR